MINICLLTAEIVARCGAAVVWTAQLVIGRFYRIVLACCFGAD